MLLTATACGGDDDSADSTTVPVAVTLPAVVTTAPAALGTVPGTVAAAPSGPDVSQACSFMTADEMSAALGTTVTVTDEGFRCKYNDPSGGWLQVELNPMDMTFSQDDLQYAKDNGEAVPGIGDEAYKFGQGVHVKIGDVYLVVEGANLSSGVTADVKAIAATIVSRIP